MKLMHSKLVALGLCAALCITSLTGCGGENTKKPSTDIGDVTTFELPKKSETSEIEVKAIDDIANDFIRGMDASSVQALENSGVKYYNYDGKEQDVFETLAESGVNYIRLRVWNDPYDKDGNGYGGGNNDVDTAIKLGLL